MEPFPSVQFPVYHYLVVEFHQFWRTTSIVSFETAPRRKCAELRVVPLLLLLVDSNGENGQLQAIWRRLMILERFADDEEKSKDDVLLFPRRARINNRQ